MYRYVCPNCLKTFLEEKRHLDWFCWKCGERVLPIGMEDLYKLEDYLDKEQKNDISR